MTREELDVMWNRALQDSVAQGEMFTRYRFAEMIVATEREGMKLNGIHTCHDQCQRPVCVAIREAVAAERERCAQIAWERYGTAGREIASAIRGQA